MIIMHARGRGAKYRRTARTNERKDGLADVGDEMTRTDCFVLDDFARGARIRNPKPESVLPDRFNLALVPDHRRAARRSRSGAGQDIGHQILRWIHAAGNVRAEEKPSDVNLIVCPACAKKHSA